MKANLDLERSYYCYEGTLIEQINSNGVAKKSRRFNMVIAGCSQFKQRLKVLASSQRCFATGWRGLSQYNAMLPLAALTFGTESAAADRV
jgi:hypothetical protein